MLRFYQMQTLELVRESIRNSRTKILVHLPTGAGKTHIFLEQIYRAEMRQKKVLVLVRRRQLVFQTVLRLQRKIKKHVGVWMGTTKNKYNVMVASIDTAIKSVDDLGDFDLVIVDEAHDCTSDGYQRVLDKYKDKLIIGYTATPYRVGRKGHKFWEDVIKPITAAQLRDQGFLVPTRIYCPSKPDLSGVTTKGGDYNVAQLEGVMSKLYGDIIKHYQKFCGYEPGRRAKRAIAFCTTVKQSKELAQKFRENHITAYHVDADTPQAERDKLIGYFEKRQQVVLCNVNVFSTGVDIPGTQAIILARPTKSRVLHLQQLGRGLRPAEGKDSCLVLDHAGNCLRLGDPYDDFEAELDDMDKGARAAKVRAKHKDCPHCCYLLPLSAKECTQCGQDVRTGRQIELDNASELVEYKGQTYTDVEFVKKMRGYKTVLEKKLNLPSFIVRNRLLQTYGERAKMVL